MPKISVIIPVYNVEKYIRECLESVEKQTFGDFEVLCIDDHGTDNSMDIVNEFAQKDDRFKILSCDGNQGSSVARNIAMDEAIGEYIFFVDSDDWLYETAFEKVIERFEKTNADSVWFDFTLYKNEEYKNIKGNIFQTDEDGFFDLEPYNVVEVPIYIWNKAYKASVLKKLGVKFPPGLFFQDSEFYFKVFTQITRVNYLAEPLYYYRVRPGSTVTRSQVEDLSRIEDMFIIFDNMYNYAKEKGIFEEYRWAFCKMMATRINCQRLEKQHDKAIKLSYEMLKKVDFPNAFSDL